MPSPPWRARATTTKQGGNAMNAKWITPAVTAMDSQGHVDMEANKAIYDFLIEK